MGWVTCPEKGDSREEESYIYIYIKFKFKSKKVLLTHTHLLASTCWTSSLAPLLLCCPSLPSQLTTAYGTFLHVTYSTVSEYLISNRVLPPPCRMGSMASMVPSLAHPPFMPKTHNPNPAAAHKPKRFSFFFLEALPKYCTVIVSSWCVSGRSVVQPHPHPWAILMFCLNHRRYLYFLFFSFFTVLL